MLLLRIYFAMFLVAAILTVYQQTQLIETQQLLRDALGTNDVLLEERKAWEAEKALKKEGTETHNTGSGRKEIIDRLFNYDWKPRENTTKPCIVLSIYSGYKFIETPGYDKNSKSVTARQKRFRPTREELEKEAKDYGDILILPGFDGWGVEMTQRIVMYMEYAELKWDEWEYFVILDDDLYLFMHRLAYDLQNRPRRHFAVGAMFCRGPENTVPDERLIILSRDIIRQILMMKYTIGLNYECNFGQAIVLWLAGTDVKWYHDLRILQLARNDSRALNDIEKYSYGLAVHHAYEERMNVLWDWERKHLESYKVSRPTNKLAPIEKHCKNKIGVTQNHCMKITPKNARLNVNDWKFPRFGMKQLEPEANDIDLEKHPEAIRVFHDD